MSRNTFLLQGSYIMLVFVIISSMLTSSCHSNKQASQSEIETDTLAVVFSHFIQDKISDSDQIHLTLIKTVHSDSIFFQYINNADSGYNFTLHTHVANELLDYNNDNFIKADYAESNFDGQTLHISKFELLDPAIDGNLYTLISNEMGLIGDAQYSWGTGIILTQFGDHRADAAFIAAMLNQENGYFMQRP